MYDQDDKEDFNYLLNDLKYCHVDNDDRNYVPDKYDDEKDSLE